MEILLSDITKSEDYCYMTIENVDKKFETTIMKKYRDIKNIPSSQLWFQPYNDGGSICASTIDILEEFRKYLYDEN